jgi:hypothetical protein
MRRWVDIKPNDVGRFGLKIRIVRAVFFVGGDVAEAT